jgi:hypothetical protein
LNRILGLNNMISLSARIEDLGYARDKNAGDGREKFKYNYASSKLSYSCNTLNTRYFPKKGTRAELSVEASKLLSSKYQSDTVYVIYDNSDLSTGSSKLFYTFHGSFDKYFTKYRKWTLCAGGEFLFVTSSDSISEMNNYFFLGGIESVSPRSIKAVGYHPLETPVNRMAGIHLDIDYEVFEKVHLTLLTGITAIKEMNGMKEISLLPGIGLGAGYLSVIGPVKAGLMYGFYKNANYFNRFTGYISVGFNF